MSKADVCAAILWFGVTLYAIFGGADFGAGSGTCSRGAASAASGPRPRSTARSGPSGRPTTSG